MLLVTAILLSYLLIRLISGFSQPIRKFSKKEQLRFAFGLGFVAIGVLHLAVPSLFVHLFSTLFSSTSEIVVISGFIQIICGIGLLIKTVYRKTAILLIVLLALFIPLSILMFTKYIHGPFGPEYEPVLSYLRILILPLLMWMLLKLCNLSPRRKLKNTQFNQNS